MILLTINIWLIVLLCVHFYSKHFKFYSRLRLVKQITDFLIIFDRARVMSYEKIYRDHVLVYLTSRVRPSEKDMIRLRHIYIETVFTYCGKNVKDDLITIYGDLDSLVAFLSTDLFKKLGDDELTSKLLNEEKKQ